MKIIEREQKMYERVEVYEKEKKTAYETLSILNKEFEKARVLLESLRKECDNDKLKIIELEKNVLYRRSKQERIKKFKKFFQQE